MTKEDIERLKELDAIHREQYEFDTMWREYNGEEPPIKRRTPWFVIWLTGILFLVMVAMITLPAVARRVHEPYVPVPPAPSVTELAQQTCARHGQSFVSWRASGYGAKEVFCRTGDSIELTQHFIRAD